MYNKIFKKPPYLKLSFVEKIDDMNKQIIQLEECINGRIQYHFNCRKYSKNYNVKSHEHEILISIYMFNRIKDIQRLLKNKHIKFKEKLQKQLDDFENLSI